MPSIRSYIASLAFLALTLSPLVSAGTHGQTAIMARDSLLKNARLERSSITAPIALAKRAEAKLAAARRALNRRTAKATRDSESSAVVEKRTGAFHGTASTSAFATYLGTKCARDKACVHAEVQAQLPTNGAAVCDLTSRHCTISCASNYLLQSDGSCLAGIVSCGTIKHGAYSIVDGQCAPSCATNLGYLLTYSSNGTPKCINVATGTSNCGGLALVCPSSYNGIGITKCYNGVCGLQCSAGLFMYKTKSGKPYCA